MMTPEATKAQQVKPNPDNERIKHQYRIYLREARQLDEQSLDAVDAALDRFEEHTGRRDFRKFRPDQATAFKRYLGKATNLRMPARHASKRRRSMGTTTTMAARPVSHRRLK